MQMDDRWTNLTKLIVAFRNFANAPKKINYAAISYIFMLF